MREALIDAFDFEWTNKNIMYGSYERTHSVFQNSPMMAKGKPDAAELALLEPFRGKVPDEVFGEPYVPPVTDGSGQDRRWLRRADQLLNEAGCALKNGKRVLPNGEPIDHRIPDRRADLRAASSALHQEPRPLGIEATLRMVDPVQYRARVDGFDFDITVERLSFSVDAGRFAAHLFHIAGGRDQRLAESRRHRRPGGRRAGRHRIIAAKTRAELTDRLPRAGPRLPRRALLGAAMVPERPLDRLLGRIRAPGAASRAISAAFRRLGGTTGTRRRNWSRRASGSIASAPAGNEVLRGA